MAKSLAFTRRVWLVLSISIVGLGGASCVFAQDIHVVAGTYGSNCGQPRGNKTDYLATTCNGRSDCTYTIDYRVIGDPASGCRKNYVAEWRCGRGGELFQANADPEAGFGSKVTLHCESAERSSRPAREIRVDAGTYGSNCGQPRGNRTDHLASACNGRAECTYTIDYRVIGDPASGCRKNYVAEWRCGHGGELFRVSADPEAGFGSKVTLSCEGAGRPSRSVGEIHVVAGTYGSNCGQPRGNKTDPLAAACNGREGCKYTIDYRVIGDPASGCRKDYVAEWRCGPNSEVYRVVAAPEAGFGSTVTLHCEP